MDRQIIYPGQIPLDTDLLNTNKNAMIAIGKLASAALGVNGVVHGLAVTPTSPASLNVNVAPGSIYMVENVDNTSYGSLAADTTDQIVKQGILLAGTQLNCPAPGTVGQSINYLIQAAFSEVDSGSVALPYYNASNPSVAWSGPNNTGTPQATTRQNLCVVTVKAGAAATTGTQATPSPDAGNIGLAVVTVANGQATITAGNIVQSTGASLVPQDGLASNVMHSIYTKNVGGAANVTLTAQEAAYPILNLIGTLTGNIQVIVPATVRQRVVNNQTTGNFSVTIIAAAGTGIVAPQGLAIPTFCDGTNVYSSASAMLTELAADARYQLSGALANGLNKVVIAGSVTLTAALHSNKVLDPYGAAANTVITLPQNAGNSFPAGFNCIIGSVSAAVTLLVPATSLLNLYLPDGSTVGPGSSFTLPIGAGYAIRLYEFASSLRLETIGRTLVANAVNSNEAVALGQFTTGQSKTSNGSQPLPGGLIFKFGTTASIPATSQGSVVFTTAFPTAILIVLVGPNASANVAQGQDGIISYSVTGFTASNQDNIAHTLNWFAVGY